MKSISEFDELKVDDCSSDSDPSTDSDDDENWETIGSG